MWTLGIQEYANPGGKTYYYTLYNAETESYLSFKDDGSSAVASEKGEDKGDARALFTAAGGYVATTLYTMVETCLLIMRPPVLVMH